MAKIYTPNRGYTGRIAGVPFKNGKGETSNKWLIQWFKNKGYEVEVKKEINLEECTVKELREIAKDKGIVGYSDMVKSELIETLRGD